MIGGRRVLYVGRRRLLGCRAERREGEQRDRAAERGMTGGPGTGADEQSEVDVGRGCP